MNFNSKYLGFILFLLIVKPVSTFSQDDTTDIIEKILDILSRDPNEDHDYSDVAERLNYYKKHPIDLNAATQEQLKELIFLSPIQINQIISHRIENGLFIDVLSNGWKLYRLAGTLYR